MKKYVLLGTIIGAIGLIAGIIVYFRYVGEAINIFFTDMENTGYDC